MKLPSPPPTARSFLRRRFACAMLAAPALAFMSNASAVTIGGDTVPHQWHSFNTPQNAFLGHATSSWNNTDPGALYAEWGGFIPDSRNGWTFSTPTVGISALTSAVLKETSGTGLLTGSGNIYGLAFGQVPGPPLVFELTVADQSGATHGPGSTRTVAMRSGTKGVLPVLDVSLNGVSATGINTFRVDGTIDMPTGPGGAMEPNTTTDGEWLWLWTNVPAAASYRFDFRATVGHMSLDNLAVYASPVSASSAPPPAAAVKRRYPALRTNVIANQIGEVLSSQTSP